MQAQLDEIDVGPLEGLTRIKTELDTLDARLEAMEARRGEVAEAVYLRVRGDYEARRRKLEDDAAPLKAAAREQYARLFQVLTRSEADHEAARLDREEIDFRHSLGEFDDTEYKQRIAGVDQQLAERAALREQAAALRERFVAAFRSEDELQSATAEPAAPPPLEPEATTQRLPTLDAAAVAAEPAPAPPLPADATRPMPLPSAADLGATQTMRVLKGDPTAPVRPDQTVMIRSARLVPQNPEAGKLTHTVGLRPLLLGSAEQCDVRLAGAAPQHAQLKVGMAGFSVADLGGGVRVNGIVIEQHLLRDEDMIEVGPARFVFREA